MNSKNCIVMFKFGVNEGFVVGKIPSMDSINGRVVSWGIYSKEGSMCMGEAIMGWCCMVSSLCTSMHQ